MINIKKMMKKEGCQKVSVDFYEKKLVSGL